MRISDWSSDVCSSDLGDVNNKIPLSWERSCPNDPPSASGRGKIGLQYLEQPRRALAAADAHRDDDIFRPAPFALDRRVAGHPRPRHAIGRSEEHTSELQSLMRISYADFCLKKQT